VPTPLPVPSPLPGDPSPAPGPKPGRGPGTGATPPAATPPAISRLRVRGCRRACRLRSSSLRFAASHAGDARVTLERRARGRYLVISRTSRHVEAGRQRVKLSALHLNRGRWRVSLGAARVAFRVR
jgi:hypothetical protein